MSVLPSGFNWSFSKLTMFEQCALRFKFKYVDRVPEPPPKPDNPMERGNREHKRLEDYTLGRTSTLNGCEGKATGEFKAVIDEVRSLISLGQGTAEQDWFFDSDWKPTTRENVWLWLKLDAFVRDDTSAVAIDYKTGKSVYKAVEHAQQLQLYAACLALKYPDIHHIVTELWYLDEGHVKANRFSSEEAIRMVDRFDQRANAIYTARYFRANPSKQTCRWCPYGANGNGHCPSAAR